MRGVGILSIAGVLAGCVLQPVGLEGKACPCASGWVCDEASQTCVVPAATETSSGAVPTTTEASSEETSGTTGPDSTTGTDPRASSSGDAPQGQFEVLAFAADWSTPESIHWAFEVEGEEADFHARTLWLATDEASLESGEGVLVFDGGTNPELDRFALKNTKGFDIVVGTVTRGLQPDTDYFAKLFVFDTAGGVSESPNVAVRSTTAVPTQSIALFADAQLSGGPYPLPTCYTWSDASPYEGTHHYALELLCDSNADPTCVDPDPDVVDCWENLRLQNMTVSIASIGGGNLSDAFLDFALAVDPGERPEGHGWWSQAGIRLGEQGFSSAPLTIPATATYERFQVPLTVLGVTLEDLDTPLERVFVGSRWLNGTQLRFDEAHIRW